MLIAIIAGSKCYSQDSTGTKRVTFAPILEIGVVVPHLEKGKLDTLTHVNQTRGLCLGLGTAMSINIRGHFKLEEEFLVRFFDQDLHVTFLNSRREIKTGATQYFVRSSIVYTPSNSSFSVGIGLGVGLNVWDKNRSGLELARVFYATNISVAYVVPLNNISIHSKVIYSIGLNNLADDDARVQFLSRYQPSIVSLALSISERRH